MEKQLIDFTKEEFNKRYGQVPEHIFMSPGRINIIGEHVDYNHGFVLPAAIDKHICFAISTSEKNNAEFYAIDLKEQFTISLDERMRPVKQMWVNYMLGVINEIRKLGKDIKGFQVALSSNIPIGAGLSSSAALECGFAYALDEIFDLRLSKKDIALIGQRAEHTYAGVKCGIMDQFASVFGKTDRVIMLDCDTLEYTYYDAKLGEFAIVLFDSKVKHSHLTSGYNDRRDEVEIGMEIITSRFPDVQTFRDVDQVMLEELKQELGAVIYKRCAFVIAEIERVGLAAEAFQNGDFKTLGSLLNQTQKGLSEDYEVSCEEIDYLVAEALKQEGVLGSRMMGGGFGGCSINLIKKENLKAVITNVHNSYKKEYGIDMNVYEVKISEGTHKFKTNENNI